MLVAYIVGLAPSGGRGQGTDKLILSPLPKKNSMSTLFAVSLEPIVGAALDVYPENVQSQILGLKPGECVYLGADCFGATVYRQASGSLHQRTPAIGTKRAGIRDVVLIDADTDTIDVVRSDEGRWIFEKGSPSREPAGEWRRLDVASSLRRPPETFLWQWSMQVDLGKAREKDWIAYMPVHSSAIESSFRAGERECGVTVGLRHYHIVFVVDEEGNRPPYAKQVDRERNRVRWVRRGACTQRSAPPPDSEVSCALCCEDFAATQAWPWTRTPCGHVFHAVCLLPIVSGPQATNRCPMCRTALPAR